MTRPCLGLGTDGLCVPGPLCGLCDREGFASRSRCKLDTVWLKYLGDPQIGLNYPLA